MLFGASDCLTFTCVLRVKQHELSPIVGAIGIGVNPKGAQAFTLTMPDAQIPFLIIRVRMCPIVGVVKLFY
jgi:hypothetical protein